jgi:hypothetical protein
MCLTPRAARLPSFAEIFFIVLVNTRVPSPSSVLSVG